jgi:hypothetical protein
MMVMFWPSRLSFEVIAKEYASRPYTTARVTGEHAVGKQTFKSRTILTQLWSICSENPRSIRMSRLFREDAWHGGEGGGKVLDKNMDLRGMFWRQQGPIRDDRES